MFGLFEKINGEWIRVHEGLEYSSRKIAARRPSVQSWLLAYALGQAPNERSIRKIKA